MITFENVSKVYGRQAIIRNGSFHVSAGERVGVVGPNGAGKSTLFNLIMDLENPDEGAIHKTKGLAMGHLPQEVGDLGTEPLLDLVVSTAGNIKAIEAELEVVSNELSGGLTPEELETLSRRQSQLLDRFEGLDGYTLKSRAEKILDGLGFDRSRFDQPVNELSGGWRMRALLARILLADPDLILLDEPTNHLDLTSMLWLEDYLTKLTATVLIVSHDRSFLNRSVSKILALEKGRMGVYSGNYDKYVREKDLQKTHLEAAHRQQQEQIRQMQRFIDRNRTRKDKAKQAQARLKALDKIERIELDQDQRSFNFNFPQPARPPAILLDLEDICLSYDGSHRVYSDLTARVAREERVALVGPNGAGKSTLLKIMAGELEPDSGRRHRPGAVKVAYFAQHQLEQLHPAMSVLEELMSVSGNATQTQMRTLLGSFLFSGDDVFKKVSVLSGGERNRLALCKLLFSGANLLLLDEPTNHLDIPSRIALEQALLAWPGEMVLVTHDRRLINVVANRIWDVAPGGSVTVYPGNLDDYVRTWSKIEEAQERESAANKPADDLRNSKPKSDKDRRRRQAQWRQLVDKETKEVKKRLNALEAEVAQAETGLDQLNAKLADPACYNDPGRAVELNRKMAKARTDLENLSDCWTETALELEEITERLEAQRQE